MLQHERKIWRSGMEMIAGVDEAGRGPLAGPVVAAAVVMRRGVFLPEVDDSKKLTPEQRLGLCRQILEKALAVGIGAVDHVTIDRINVLNATFRAMHLAVTALEVRPEHLLIDGNRFSPEQACGAPVYPIPYTTLVDGDELSFSVASASIIAKVTRDRIMEGFDRIYPGYGFARHKGYATEAHREAITRLGITPIHRRSFGRHVQARPVSDVNTENADRRPEANHRW
jgi:ribonuclease HII